MGILFWIARPRNLLILAGLLLCLRYWFSIESFTRRWHNEWRYPPQSAMAAGGKEILDKLEQKQAQKILFRHRRISAKLDKARGDGFNIDGLQAKANAALTMNVPAYREQAIKVLNEVEMRVPRKKTSSRR
ncbi:MAG: hypothetical protein A3J74_07215 [Elusimicrobia bacterium RIFCSPHIGHO2_02_FULL_57_9]|nr:MAG: hypothetical protein A3J74_07215 [Elusimicrobia bacterium RIFCSPHIGHO2_02_FULL_57_9]